MSNNLRLQDYVTVREAAEMYEVTRQQMHNLIKIHKVKIRKFAGSLMLISKKELKKVPKNRPVGIHTSK